MGLTGDVTGSPFFGSPAISRLERSAACGPASRPGCLCRKEFRDDHLVVAAPLEQSCAGVTAAPPSLPVCAHRTPRYPCSAHLCFRHLGCARPMQEDPATVILRQRPCPEPDRPPLNVAGKRVAPRGRTGLDPACATACAASEHAIDPVASRRGTGHPSARHNAPGAPGRRSARVPLDTSPDHGQYWTLV
jgi:hypothetical protein